MPGEGLVPAQLDKEAMAAFLAAPQAAGRRRAWVRAMMHVVARRNAAAGAAPPSTWSPPCDAEAVIRSCRNDDQNDQPVSINDVI
jgi:hypothetical protein